MSEEATTPGDRPTRRWSRWRAFTAVEWVAGIVIIGLLALTLAISVLAIT